MQSLMLDVSGRSSMSLVLRVQLGAGYVPELGMEFERVRFGDVDTTETLKFEGMEITAFTWYEPVWRDGSLSVRVVPPGASVGLWVLGAARRRPCAG